MDAMMAYSVEHNVEKRIGNRLPGLLGILFRSRIVGELDLVLPRETDGLLGGLR